MSTPSASSVDRRRSPNGSAPTTPQNPDGMPILARATATLAGAPPGRATNASASTSDGAPSDTMMSISSSPRLRTEPETAAALASGTG
jgi:hypothetical protein